MATLSVEQVDAEVVIKLVHDDGREESSTHVFDNETEAAKGMIRAAEIALGMATASIAGKSDVKQVRNA